MKKKTLIIISCVTIILLAVAGVLFKIKGYNDSIGIIGGADGPTAIFVSGNPVGYIAAIAAVVLLIIAVILLIKRRK